MHISNISLVWDAYLKGFVFLFEFEFESEFILQLNFSLLEYDFFPSIDPIESFLEYI